MIKTLITSAVLAAILFIYGCKDNPTSPVIEQSNIQLISTYSTYASTNGLFVMPVDTRNYAFIADGSSGMQIIDVTNVAVPDSISAYDTDGDANDITVAVINGYLYAFISDYDNGCVVVDVSNPFDPQFVGSISVLPGDYVETAFVDAARKILYFGHSTGHVNIYDISALPGAPVYISSIYLGGTINGLYSTGSTLYAASGDVGVQIINVTNPFTPSIISSFNTPGLASNIAVVTNYAYVADSYNGLLIYNVSNPSSPILLSRYAPNQQILGISINNNSIYTADNGYGVESVNISTPSDPVNTGYIKTNSSALNIFYFGGYLYLAAAEGGMAIFRPTN